VKADEANIAAIRTKLWTARQGQDDYVAAKKAYDAAQEAYASACKAVIDQLAKNPDYQAAVAKKAKASTALDNFEASDSSDPEDRANLATAKMEAGAAVTKMEGEAETADDNCAKAKAALVAAQDALDKIQQDFNSTLDQDTDYAAAQAKLKADEASGGGSGTGGGAGGGTGGGAGGGTGGGARGGGGGKGGGRGG
jgi:hypothetical protein